MSIPENPKPLMTRQDVLGYLGICSAMLWKISKEKNPEKRLPSYKLGRCRKYKWEDIVAWVERQKAA